MREVYIVSAARTAVGTFGGALKDTPATELGKIVIQEVLKRGNVAPDQVDEVYMGCVCTSGLGQNVQRTLGNLSLSIQQRVVQIGCNQFDHKQYLFFPVIV
jgi:acetyl-CoA C-acetyltransferase